MTILSDDLVARTRDVESALLRRISELGQNKIADQLGVSTTEMSRKKAQYVQHVAELLAVLQLAVYPAGNIPPTPEEFFAVKQLAKLYLDREA